MKFMVSNPKTWLACRGCGTMWREHGMLVGVRRHFCPNCDDWQDYRVIHYEGDILEVLE